jgi:hypothetical protein
MRAYVLGAFGVVMLGGREGATINYLLDLAAASCLALASMSALSSAGRVARADVGSTPLAAQSGPAPLVPVGQVVLVPLLLAGQVVLGTYLLVSGILGGTGSWADPRRAALVGDLARTAPHLAEDSGLLVANGIAPEVDDLFLWSRLVQRGAVSDEITARVRNGAFATVIAETRLEEIESAPAYARQRWPEALVREVLAVYRLETALPGHYRYVPRRGVAHD